MGIIIPLGFYRIAMAILESQLFVGWSGHLKLDILGGFNKLELGRDCLGGRFLGLQLEVLGSREQILLFTHGHLGLIAHSVHGSQHSPLRTSQSAMVLRL
jgi:hypothetical protein